MSDSLATKLEQLDKMLENKKVPGGLENLLNLFQSTKDDNSSSSSDNDGLSNVKNVMDLFSSQNDPRIDLIHALMPFLGNDRQKKASECVKLLKYSSITKLFFENKSLFGGGKLF